MSSRPNLDVRPWVYRAYELDGQLLIEISPFRTADDPLEDQAETEGDGFYILNTNIKNDAQDDEAMLAEKKAAAYFEPWKFKIARLKKGDHVFLYRSGVGIVAAGKATGRLKKASYHGRPEHEDEEYSMALEDFIHVTPPLAAAEVKEISGNSGLVFRQTMFSLDREAGSKLHRVVSDRIAGHDGAS